MQSDLGELRARIVRYLSITALILLASLAAGVLMATRLQRRISGPILALVAAARSVSSDRNYAVRVNATSRDEIGLLGQTFNEMLEQIARQDAELRLAVRARDEFLSIASHELKTPLTPLQLQVQKLQLLLRKQAVAPGDRLASGLEIADRQVLRLSKLVENLLDISRITSKRMELEIEPVDLAAVAREVVARFQYEAVQAGCKVTLQAEGAVIGMWDRSRIDQVLTNFLSNAIKYGAGQPIELWVEHHDGLARFRIRDHGIGIAADDQARIFQRFERAVSSHSYGGFGLGLWIVKQIVDAFGGSIQVESAPRQGATFTMDLPRGSAPNMN